MPIFTGFNEIFRLLFISSHISSSLILSRVKYAPTSSGRLSFKFNKSKLATGWAKAKLTKFLTLFNGTFINNKRALININKGIKNKYLMRFIFSFIVLGPEEWGGLYY